MVSSMNQQQWTEVNSIFLRHRRDHQPIPIHQMQDELRRRAGLKLSSQEFRELYLRFNFRLHIRDGYIVAD